MKSGGIRSAVIIALTVCVSPSASLALDLYHNTVDPYLPGPNLSPGVWAWNSCPHSVCTYEITETGGVGGTQSYRQTTDSTGEINNGWWWQWGFGQFAVGANENYPLAGGVEGSNNPARYRFSMDVNISGNNGGGGTTPLELGIVGIDEDYEATHNIDVNNDGDFADGAVLYDHGGIKPTVLVSGEWVNISYTFDQGTPNPLDSDIPLMDQGFSNALSLQWYAGYSAVAFGYDADNVVNMDNFRTEFLAGQNGDYNSDGKVDAADYVVWRKNAGTTNSLPNDNGIGGTVGTAHYNLWRANFGNPSSSSGTGLNISPVPEPTTLVLAAVIAAGGCLLSAPRRRWRTK